MESNLIESNLIESTPMESTSMESTPMEFTPMESYSTSLPVSPLRQCKCKPQRISTSSNSHLLILNLFDDTCNLAI